MFWNIIMPEHNTLKKNLKRKFNHDVERRLREPWEQSYIVCEITSNSRVAVD